MKSLKDKYYELYDKTCDRCTKCPFYYYERGWEDNSEGCELKGWSWDEGLCINMFLPQWILKLKYRLYRYKQDKFYRKYLQDNDGCIDECDRCKNGYWDNDDGWQCRLDKE